MWGAVELARMGKRSNRSSASSAPRRRILTRTRLLVAVAALVVFVVATVFVVQTRDDLHAANRGLVASRHHQSQLRVALNAAVLARTEATVALEHAREVLRADTASRDQLRETGRSEFQLLTLAIENLAQQQAALAAGTARAKRLDECLIAASQALNQAAVGDVVHLAITLPHSERLCAVAEA